MSSPGQKFGLSANMLLGRHRDREARTPSRGVLGRCCPRWSASRRTPGCWLPRAAATGGRPDAVALVLQGPLSGTQARETLARGPRRAPTATPALGPAPAIQGRPEPASGKEPAQAPVPGLSLQATLGGTQPGRCVTSGQVLPLHVLGSPACLCSQGDWRLSQTHPGSPP